MSQSASLLIVGAGGHGKVVADVAVATKRWRHIAFADDRFPEITSVAGLPVLETAMAAEQLCTQYADVIVAIGDNATRLRTFATLAAAGAHFATIIHPTASVSERATLGPGTIVMAQAAVNIESQIASAVIVNTSASVDHDCRISDGAHISPGAHLGGGVSVGIGGWVGIGASVIQQITIGDWAKVGAGACVVRDVNPDTTVIGVPATPLL
ncbi:MAG: acetyltransferase [Gammaproteobacteria bacterium]|nr:acetyltransferase [Gammaproteobacteria bacterium]